MRHELFIDPDGKAVRRSSIDFKRRLAMAMAMPLRTVRDYTGIARKMLQVDPLPQGALPIYDRDVDIGIVFEEKGFKQDKFRINSEGKTVFHRFGYVTLPRFETYSNPTIKIADVKQRRFNLIDRVIHKNGFRIDSDGKVIHRRRRRFQIIDRAVQKARAEIMAQEDAAIFKALDEAPEPEEKKESFWCEGCGEPRYKCYCDAVCKFCGKLEKDCSSESESGYCPQDPDLDKWLAIQESINNKE